MFFISPHPFPLTSGDIEAFKNMPITYLNLQRCKNLTGEWVGISLLKNSEFILIKGCCPRASPLMGNFPGTFFISPHPSSTYPTTPGDIEVFKGMELTKLNLYLCKQLTGVFGFGWAW